MLQDTLFAESPPVLSLVSRLLPDSALEWLAKRSVCWWAMSAVLPDPDNRISLRRGGSLQVNYLANNLEAHDRLVYRWLDTMKKVEADPDTTVVQAAPIYPRGEAPLSVMGLACGTCRMGSDPARLGGGSRWSLPSAGQPLDRRCQHPAQLSGGGSGPHRDRPGPAPGRSPQGQPAMTEASATATATDSECSEARRIAERDQGLAPWDLWGSYLPDRQWGTVREDYSADGDAWRSFPHDQARSRVYRWGEDGLLGLCDAECRLCFSVALWNGVDPILKERPFGLGNPEGNHGEDIKDYYFHLANTPTHAFMRGLYRYPQRQFPYQQLLEENGRRGRDQPEYELIDTGIFEDDRYFDLEITYAKASATDILIRLRAVNRARVAAPLTLLPTLWLRNTWSWGYPEEVEHRLQASGDGLISEAIPNLGRYGLRCGEAGRWLFTDNETNHARLYGKPNPTPFQKDGFHRYVIAAETGAVNPAGNGSKAAILLQRLLEPGEEWVVDLRLQALDGASGTASPTRARRDHDPLPPDPFGAEFSRVLNLREQQWHDYFSQCAPGLGDDDRRIFLAASAGLLWCKKYYGWSVLRWLEGDPTQPPPPAQRWGSATAEWQRLHAHDVISMPDAWEYPYFCQWDLMFHAVAFAGIDPTTAKEQCLLLRSPHYTAPNAQTPAYEWALSDPNPPIGAWAAMRIFQIDRKNTEEADSAFLARSLRKLLLEYGWWANRNDRSGDNVFDGGFLGLDNIAVFDRRFPLADGSHIKQCDGTAWMASLSLNLLQIAVELSREQPDVADLCERFVVDYVQLAIALNSQDDNSVLSWDEQDGFYYDVIQRPDGSFDYLRSRSITGLIPSAGRDQLRCGDRAASACAGCAQHPGLADS